MSNSVKDKFLAEPEFHANTAYESLKGDLQLLDRQFQTLNLSAVFGSMAMAHENLSLLAYFAHGDIAAFKQHSYLVAKLHLHASRHLLPNDYYMSGGDDHFAMDTSYLFPLISDNRAVIEEIAVLETPPLLKYRDNTKAAEFAFHLAQLVIRGDYEAAQAKIEKGAKKGGGHLKKACATGTDFYSLLMKGDKSGLEAAIMDSTKFKKSDSLPMICDFVYPGATFKAKLCWYKGIPVEIEHPMVPMRWMPVEPLPHYDDIYDFFSPNWIPPEQGVLARLSRRFKRDNPAIDGCMQRIRRIDERDL